MLASLDAYRAELSAAAAPAAAARPCSTAGTAGRSSAAGAAGVLGSSAGALTGSKGSGESCSTAEPANLTALLSFEMGGGNGLEPLSVGARMGLPVLDADFMGRAFPEMQAGSYRKQGLPVELAPNCMREVPGQVP